VIAGLRQYFSHVPAGTGEPDMEVIAIDREAPDTGIDFVDWQREPGKTGRKDSWFDVPGGRVVRKVRTGMVFLQSETQRIAAGPCLEYDNQVINFINAQYMNWLQHRGWLICHSAGLVYRGSGFGIAGFSGGGKSTLMLHLLEHDAVSYLTNDRLFVRKEAGQTRAVGIPKLPRVNPGTIVHNARLQGLALYNLRYGWLISGIAACKMALTRKKPLLPWHALTAYIRAYMGGKPRMLSKEQGRFARNWRWKGILNRLLKGF